MEFKNFEENRNGMVMNIREDESSIGMHIQVENMDFDIGPKMDRGTTDHKVFDNNGGYSKADGAGTINKNGEYGPITYGF